MDNRTVRLSAVKVNTTEPVELSYSSLGLINGVRFNHNDYIWDRSTSTWKSTLPKEEYPGWVKITQTAEPGMSRNKVGGIVYNKTSTVTMEVVYWFGPEDKIVVPNDNKPLQYFKLKIIPATNMFNLNTFTWEGIPTSVVRGGRRKAKRTLNRRKKHRRSQKARI